MDRISNQHPLHRGGDQGSVERRRGGDRGHRDNPPWCDISQWSPTEFPSLGSSVSTSGPLRGHLSGDLQRASYASTLTAVVADGQDNGGSGGEYTRDADGGDDGTRVDVIDDVGGRDKRGATAKPIRTEHRRFLRDRGEKNEPSRYRQRPPEYAEWRDTYIGHLVTLYHILLEGVSKRSSGALIPSKEDFDRFTEFVYDNSSGYISPYA